MFTTIFNVSGIDSTNFATTLRNAITSIQGVANVSVDIDKSKVTITFDPAQADISTIKSAITNSGAYIH